MIRAWSHRLARAAHRWFLPERAKNSLRQRLLLEERDRPARGIERFDESPVLVLAPHMDDEVLGPGGALRRHVLAGSSVAVVFLTDGAADPDVPSERRRAESRAAAERLGLERLHFLDAPDGAYEADREHVARLAELLDTERPRLIYLPSIFEEHADHWVATLALDRALAELVLEPAPVLRQYEVWSPLVPNRIADVGSVWPEVRAALECFTSQRPALDLVRVAEGLAAFRAGRLDGGRGFAEAFLESSVDEFRRMLALAQERRR